MHVEDDEGSVFVVPPSKRDQSPIIFDRVWHQIIIFNDSAEDLEPPQFFHMHGQHTVWWRKWDMTCIMVKAWISKRHDTSLYNLLCRKESQSTSMSRRAGGWDMSLLPAQSESEFEESLLSHFSDSSTENLTLVWGYSSKKISSPIWRLSVP